MTSIAKRLIAVNRQVIDTLSDREAYILLMALEAEMHRESLKRFLVSIWHVMEPMPFVDGWVIDCLCEHFTALANGEFRKIAVNIPPRHTKSLFLVAFRAWLWTRNAQERVLAASYNLDLSLRDNLRVRRVIESPWFQARYGDKIKLQPDQKAKYYYENTAGGYQMALSVAGGVTGHGGSYLIIDDPHNADEAHSDVERATALSWFREVWTNRLNDQTKDKMIVVGQRIHDQDVCGYIIRERPDWVHLNLPAYYEPSYHCVTPILSDPRKVEGNLLWPERFSNATLEGLRRDLGSMGFAAQYQQTPVPSGGGQFKSEWFRYFSETDEAYLLEKPEGVSSILKDACWNFVTVDLAISSKQTADFTVFAVWSVTPTYDLLLLKLVRAHLDNPSQVKQLRSLHQEFPSAYFKIERTGYQLALVQQALAEGIPCKAYLPIKDKVSRASTASIWMENGKMYFRKSAAWLTDMESELLLFPRAAHDDIVDVCGMAADEVVTPRVPLSGDDDVPSRQEVVVQQDPFKWIEEREGGW